MFLKQTLYASPQISFMLNAVDQTFYLLFLSDNYVINMKLK